MKRQPKKLALRSEAIRALTAADKQQMIGGFTPTSTNQVSICQSCGSECGITCAG